MSSYNLIIAKIIHEFIHMSSHNLIIMKIIYVFKSHSVIWLLDFMHEKTLQYVDLLQPFHRWRYFFQSHIRLFILTRPKSIHTEGTLSNTQAANSSEKLSHLEPTMC